MWISLIFSISLGALGQIFMKEAMKGAGPVPLQEGIPVLFHYFLHVFLSPFLLGALASYGVSILLWLSILSVSDLSLIRPLMSAGYIITMAYGYYAGENVTGERILGTLLIVVGLVFVAHSGREG